MFRNYLISKMRSRIKIYSCVNTLNIKNSQLREHKSPLPSEHARAQHVFSLTSYVKYNQNVCCIL